MRKGFPMMAKSVKIIQQREMDYIRELCISTDTVTSPVPVFRTDRWLMIARFVLQLQPIHPVRSSLRLTERDYPACFCSPKLNPGQDLTGLVAVLYSPAGHHIKDWKLNLFIDMLLRIQVLPKLRMVQGGWCAFKLPGRAPKDSRSIR